MENKTYGAIMSEMILGTVGQAQQVADCIEKMLDTEANSIERKQAKENLVKALLRE